jgi:hypothetical protein
VRQNIARARHASADGFGDLTGAHILVYSDSDATVKAIGLPSSRHRRACIYFRLLHGSDAYHVFAIAKNVASVLRKFQPGICEGGRVTGGNGAVSGSEFENTDESMKPRIVLHEHADINEHVGKLGNGDRLVRLLL